jgi:hypothetical protein
MHPKYKAIIYRYFLLSTSITIVYRIDNGPTAIGQIILGILFSPEIVLYTLFTKHILPHLSWVV